MRNRKSTATPSPLQPNHMRKQQKSRQANNILLSHDLHAAAAVDLIRRTRASESEQVAGKTPPTTSLRRLDDVLAFLRLEADPPLFSSDVAVNLSERHESLTRGIPEKMRRGEASDGCAVWKSTLMAGSSQKEDLYNLARH